jgi:phage gpG-like protein
MARRTRKRGVTDTDKGYADLRRTLAKIRAERPYVVVGIRGQAGAQTYQDEAGKGDAISLVEVGAVHEFGSRDGRIPERSYMRSTFDRNRDDYERGFKRSIGRVVDGTAEIDTELGRLGLVVAGDIQETIATLTDPPLAQYTIDKKGSSKPLIETGRLKQSIDHEVRRGDG